MWCPCFYDSQNICCLSYNTSSWTQVITQESALWATQKSLKISILKGKKKQKKQPAWGLYSQVSSPPTITLHLSYTKQCRAICPASEASQGNGGQFALLSSIQKPSLCFIQKRAPSEIQRNLQPNKLLSIQSEKGWRQKRGRIHTGLFGGGQGICGMKIILKKTHLFQKLSQGLPPVTVLFTQSHSAKITGKWPTLLNTSSEHREQEYTAKMHPHFGNTVLGQ